MSIARVATACIGAALILVGGAWVSGLYGNGPLGAPAGYVAGWLDGCQGQSGCADKVPFLSVLAAVTLLVFGIALTLESLDAEAWRQNPEVEP